MKTRLLLALPLLLLAACSSPAPPGVLAPPAGLTATAGDGQVSLAWPSSDEKSLASYVVKLESKGDVPGEMFVTAPATGTTVKQLTNGQSYSFRVALETTAKQRSAFSEAVTATPKAPPPPGGGDKPKVATPTGFSVVAGDASVTASWQANSETDLKGYTLVWGTAPDALSESKDVAAATTTATTATVDGLTNGTTYFFAVAAQNAKGETSARSALETATPTAVLRQPAIDSVAIEGYGSRLQVRQGATFRMNVTGQRLGNVSAAALGAVPATVLSNTEAGVGLEITVPHGQALGFLTLSLTTGDGTATRTDAAEVTEIWAAKSEKFKPSDDNPGTKERPFSTLTRALAVAAGGDTVFLGAGTYEVGEAWSPNQVPNVPTGVTIVGQARDLVTLQGPGAETGVSALVFANDATVRNLVVREFNVALVHVNTNPGGSDGIITLDNLEVAENYQGFSDTDGYILTITNSTFLFNGSSAGKGCGVCLYDTYHATLQDTTLKGNNNGLDCAQNGNLDLKNVTVQESEHDGIVLYEPGGAIFFNTVTSLDNGGNGIDVTYANFTMRNSNISGNKKNGLVIAGDDYGAWDLGNAESAGNNTFAGNTGWQLLDDRAADTGVTIAAQGNTIGAGAMTPGVYTATTDVGLELRADGVNLWRISRRGNSLAF